MNSGTSNQLNRELAELHAASSAFAAHFIPDANVRSQYMEQTKKFSIEIQHKVATNQLKLQAAAQQAQSVRNTILEAQRGKSTAFGQSIAEFLKKDGKTLSELEAKYATERFGKGVDQLSHAQKNTVWKTIIQKSGEARASANSGAKWMGRAGKGLFGLTIAISIYNIASAEDKVRATANEGAAIGGGVAGGAALGAAGVACGPAAVVCVPLGIFIGSVLGAEGADWAFDRLWR